MNLKIGILADDRFLEHETGAHVETPQRLRVIYDMLEEEGLWKRVLPITPRPATGEEVTLNHSPAYVNMLQQMGPGYLDADTVLSERSFDIALLAVGGCLNMVDAIMEEEISRGFAFVRPPGHHAERDRGMGFCLFNNIAIAARYLTNKHNLKRIAIVDWDLHHGNGTQHSFYSEKEVLYMSIHQSPCYPGTGLLREAGEGDGEGFTVNLPIPAGIGDEGYLKAFSDIFVPIISQYKPEIILVSAGFDPHRDDPLGGMYVTAGGFGEMGDIMMKASDNLCGGKIAFFLEGGYSLQGIKESVKVVLQRALGGEESSATPPMEDIAMDRILNEARTIYRRYWEGF